MELRSPVVSLQGFSNGSLRTVASRYSHETGLIAIALLRITISPSPAVGITAGPIRRGWPMPSSHAASLFGKDIVAGVIDM